MSVDEQAKRWSSHPFAATVVRFGIFIVPFVTAMIVAYVLSDQLPLASATPYKLLRWAGIIVVSSIAMMGMDRIARRLLPLSALLKLTLVFPDQAPSRFNLAMRVGTTAQLKKRLEAAREVPLDETAQQASERLLELVALLSRHDRLTRGHSERVRAYTHLIGEELGLTESELDKLRWAGLLHDVGKTSIAPEILNKPGRLSDAEFEIIKTHPEEGRALVGPLAAWLGESVRAVWEHHERFDGAGYPRGLAGVDISFAARVVAVADSYDVMTSARSYKQPMSAVSARAELAECSGSQFDPVVVRAFMNISLGRLRLMSGPLAFLAQLALFEPSGVVHAGTTAASAGVGSTTVGSAVGAATAGTATTIVASTGAATVASSAAILALGVVAGTAGIVVSSPAQPGDLRAEYALAVGDELPLLGPDDTVVVIDSGDFVDDGPTAAPSDSQDAEVRPENPSSDVSDSTATASPSSTVAAEPDAEVSSVRGPATPASPGSPSESPPTTSVSAPPPAPATTAVRTAPPTTPPTPTAVVTAVTTASSSTPTTNPSRPGRYAPLGNGPTFYLGDGSPLATPAPAFRAFASNGPPNVPLPNTDTDRDAYPGARVHRSVDGIMSTDPTSVVVFAGEVANPLSIDDDVNVSLWVADDKFRSDAASVQVGLFSCTADDQCELLGEDTQDANLTSFNWDLLEFELDDIEAEIAPGERLELRVGVPSGSSVAIAFGTQQYSSNMTFDSDD